MRESKVESYFKKRVKEAGGETRKVKWIGRAGAPDRYTMLPAFPLTVWDDPYVAWVELKRPKKGAEAHQAREHKRLRGYGLNVFVIDTLEKVDKFIVGKL